MKTLRLFLFLALLVSSVTVASAFFVRPIDVWCENSQSWTHAFLVFDDNGRLKAASGIDCNGEAWSKTYDMYTGPSGTQAWIANISSATAKVSANEDVDVQLVDFSNNGGDTFGDVLHIAAANQPVLFNISTLPTGTYGVIVTKNGKTVDMLTFDKR